MAEGTNNSAIEMHAAGVNEAMLIDYIRTTPKPQFDATSAKGITELSKAGLLNTVVRAMRERMSAAPAAPAAAAKPTTATPKPPSSGRKPMRPPGR